MAWYPSFVVDGTVLLDRTTLNSYCPVCKDDALVKKIATWLNSQL
ncbi:MAG: hypothetical protein Q4B28_02640 [bacterium]|nr:hypothetical protein [bacterium]